MLFLGGSTDVKSPFHTTAQVSVSVSPDYVDTALKREDFDLLHFHEPWVPIIGRQILTKSDTINIATFHAKLPDNVMTRTIERVIKPYTRSILKYIDGYTAVSNPAGEWISQLTDEPIHLVPNGIDLTKYKPLASGKKSKQPTIFYVGRLEKRKGVRYLILAFQKLLETLPDARLVLAGEGPDRERLEELVEMEDIPNVEFLGFISDAEKIKQIQNAGVFCSPALYGESFGIVLIEAMACGTPVVAGANDGYASVMTGRGAIGLVNPKETDDFARRLQLLLVDDAIRSAWKDWAAEEIKQYDYRKVVDGYEALYRQLLSEKA
jgi:phosphatidylinositol alpha-mannosyltransferase